MPQTQQMATHLVEPETDGSVHLHLALQELGLHLRGGDGGPEPRGRPDVLGAGHRSAGGGMDQEELLLHAHGECVHGWVGLLG
ncbi:hypothetical protein GCM10025734_05340 [Kitasatospora paranensis]